MSDLEIHVTSTPLRGINSVEVSVCGVGGGQPCRKLIVDVCNGRGAPSATVIERGTMQKDESLRMEQELEEEELDGLEGDSDAFSEGLTLDISTSRPGTPVMTGTSPPIPIPCSIPFGTTPLGSSPLGTGPLAGTPPRSSSFSYFCRFSSPEATSPLSSGYGSAPRFFQSASTQTPPLSPILLETQIRLRLLHSSSSSQDSSPEERVRRRRQHFREESGRTRFFSEGSAEPDSVGENSPENAIPDSLPDVVAFRRSRANSAPARPVAPEIATGRELRRIGDEFVVSFEGERSLRRNGPHRRSFIRRLLDSLSSDPDSPPAVKRTPTLVREGSVV